MGTAWEQHRYSNSSPYSIGYSMGTALATA